MLRFNQIKMYFLDESQLPKLICSESDFIFPNVNEKDDDDDKTTLTDSFMSNKIFVNCVDSYHGRHISKFLANQTIEGQTVEYLGEENEEATIATETIVNETPLENSKKDESGSKYIVIGTANAKDYVIPKDIKEIVNINDRSVLLRKLLSCKYIIYDVSEDPNQVGEAAWAIQALDEEFDKNLILDNENQEANESRSFILISTVLTWAKTKPLDPDESDAPFTEDNYRLRKAHPNYKKYLNLEKEVIRIGKKHKKDMKTIVVASGLVYGLEENLMGILFELAWLNEPFLPCFPPGNNNVPLLHIDDLASIIYNLVEMMPKKKWYILAMEETVLTLRDIVKAISKGLGTGKVVNVTQEEALALKGINIESYDHLTINLNMEPEYILENMDLKHVPDDKEMNFLENIENTVSDFITIHGLKPIKIFIHGPPLSGKTFLAHKLCRHYQLHYLCSDNVIQDFSKGMIEKKKELEEKESGVTSENEDEEEDDESNDENESELLELFQHLEDAKLNNVIPDEDVVTKIFKEKLLSKPCQKQGFVLDGYPETYEQAKKIFCLNEDEDNEEEEEEDEEDEAPVPFVVNKAIMPGYIFNLEADDLLLLKRATKVPPERNIDNCYSEDNLKKNIIDFRIANMDVSTVMNFFSEVDNFPCNISVNNDERPLLEKAFQKMLSIIGNPSNLGPQVDEEEKISEEEKALIILQQEEALRDKLIQERLEKLERRKKMEEWATIMSNVMKKEEELLEARTIPIREYLLKEIFPYLKDGILEIYRIKPKDPVEYLAEYLFTHYIDGKVFPPGPSDVTDDNLCAALNIFLGFNRK